MRYSRGPGRGGSCSGSEERNRGRSGVERRRSQALNNRVVGTDATVVRQIVSGICVTSSGDWFPETIFPRAVNTQHIGGRGCTTRRARRVCVGSRRPAADVPTHRPRPPREETRTRETCWDRGPRPSRPRGPLPRNSPKMRTCAGRCVTTAPRRPPPPPPRSGAWRWRYRSETTGCKPSTGRPGGARAFPSGGARDRRFRIFLTTARVASRRIVPEPPPRSPPLTSSPDPLRSPLPPPPPLTSSPSPSHQTVLLQHEDPRGIVGPSRVRGPRDSPGDLPPLRRPAEHPRDGAPPARRVEKGTPPAPRVRDATHQNRSTATPPAGRPPSLRVPATLPRRRGPAVRFVPLVPRPAPVRHQTVVGVRERRARRLDARRNPRRSRRRVRTRTRTRTTRTRPGRYPRRERARRRRRLERLEREVELFISDGASARRRSDLAFERDPYPRLDQGARRALGFGVLPPRRDGRVVLDAPRERLRLRPFPVGADLFARGPIPSRFRFRPAASARARASSIDLVLERDGRGRGGFPGRRAAAVAQTERRRRTVGGGAATRGGVPRGARVGGGGGVASSPRETKSPRVTRRFGRGGGGERTVRARTRAVVRRTRPRARGDQTRRRAQKSESRVPRRVPRRVSRRVPRRVFSRVFVASAGAIRVRRVAAQDGGVGGGGGVCEIATIERERAANLVVVDRAANLVAVDVASVRNRDERGSERGGDRDPASLPRSTRAREVRGVAHDASSRGVGRDGSRTRGDGGAGVGVGVVFEGFLRTRESLLRRGRRRRRHHLHPTSIPRPPRA